MSRILSAIRAPLRRLSGNKPLVTVVELQGAIGVDARPGRGLSAYSVESSLQKAFKYDDAKAVVLAINSPGGAPAQARMIMERVRHLSREKQIPTLSYIEDVGASGGYMIALAADEIYADPFAIVGSIGVIAAGFGFQDAIDKLGVERRVHTAGDNKMRLDPFQPEKPEDREKLEALLSKTHALFIDMVKRRRGDKLKSDDERVFSGDFFLAGEGEELGLIDGTGDLRTLLKERYGNDVKVKLISAQKTGILGKLGAAAIDAGVGSVMSRLDTRALRSRFGL